jgi:tetratricopeptide (TPR) repeat protein
VEKIPFLALSAASATVTYLTQRVTGAVKPFAMFPLGGRVANALTTEVVYIVKMFWPRDLAIFYPYPDQPDMPRAIAAALLLFSISAVVLFCLRSRSYLAVGWFWYLITLVPVIGLVQVGVQARADRYMYLPMVGLAIMLAFGGDDLVRHWPRAKLAVAGLAAGGLIALVPVTWVQLGYWKDNETVFRHAIDVTPANSISYYELAQGLSLLPGRQSDAITAFELGLSVLGDNDRLHAALGATLLETHLPENVPLAEQHLRAALRIRPSYADAHANLAAVLIKTGRFAEAVDHARWALQSKPENPATHNDLSVALDETGHPQEAIDEAKKALALKPDFLEAHQNLGATLFRLGRLDEATSEFSEVVRLYPDNAEGHYDLGLALEKTGKNPQALHEFEEAVRLAPDYRPAQLRLGLFLSRMPDRIPEAVSHIQAALNLRPDPNLRKLLEKLQSAPPSGVTVARSGTRPAAQ